MSDQDIKEYVRSTISVGSDQYIYYSLPKLGAEWGLNLSKLPFSIRILLENALRNCDGYLVTDEDIKSVTEWTPDNPPSREFRGPQATSRRTTGRASCTACPPR